MTEINFTGKSLRSPEDLKRLIKDAKWQVKHYSEELQRASDTLYTRQLSLDALLKEESDVLGKMPISQLTMEQINSQLDV